MRYIYIYIYIYTYIYGTIGVCFCGNVRVCVSVSVRVYIRMYMWNLGTYYVLRITVTVNTSENTRTWWNNLALWGWSLPVQPPLGLTDTRPTLGPTARYTTAPTQQQTSPILHYAHFSPGHRDYRTLACMYHVMVTLTLSSWGRGLLFSCWIKPP